MTFQLATGTLISALPTGTIDNLTAVIPVTVGMPSSPQTIRQTLLQFSNFLQSQGLMISGSYNTIQTNYISPAYIDGLNINYQTSGSITVKPGTAYVPSLGRNVLVTGAITVSFPIIASATSTGTWQNVYLQEVEGVASIQVTGTNPSTPYSGYARTKSGDNSLRYLGSIMCDAGGYAYKFDSNVFGNAIESNWIAQNDGVPFSFAFRPTGTSVQTNSIAHLMPTTGLITEMMVMGVVVVPATTAFAAAYGATIDTAISSPFQSLEVYFRVDNQAASAETMFFPPSAVKVKDNTLLSIVSTGLVSLNLRAKGYKIPR